MFSLNDPEPPAALTTLPHRSLWSLEWVRERHCVTGHSCAAWSAGHTIAIIRQASFVCRPIIVRSGPSTLITCPLIERRMLNTCDWSPCQSAHYHADSRIKSAENSARRDRRIAKGESSKIAAGPARLGPLGLIDDPQFLKLFQRSPSLVCRLSRFISLNTIRFHRKV